MKIIEAGPEHLFWIRILFSRLMDEKPDLYPSIHTEADLDDFTRTIALAMQSSQVMFVTFLAFKGHKAIPVLKGLPESWVLLERGAFKGCRAIPVLRALLENRVLLGQLGLSK